MSRIFGRTFLGLLLLYFAIAASGQTAVPQGLPNIVPGVIVVISDLHLGRGEVEIGTYDNQEDFQWGEDFITFLDAIDRIGGGKVTLIIAGDMFELWESSADDCLDDGSKFGCSEAEAKARMIKVVNAHRLELQALGAFASRGGNQVVIIPGNHDAAIIFDGVWHIVQLAARPERPATFNRAKDGRWISPTNNVIVEHGHQFDEANKFIGWPMPFTKETKSGIERLHSPFGENLVRQFFDQLERDKKYAVVDNITGGAGVLYGVKRDGILGSASVLTDFIKFIALDTSWRQIGELLTEPSPNGAPPTWDIQNARNEPVKFLRNGLPLDAATAPLVQEVLDLNDPKILEAAAQTLNDMKPEDINQICTSRYAAETQAGQEGTAAPPLCAQEGGDLGYLKQKFVQKVRGSMHYVDQHLATLKAELKLEDSPPVTFVYGHTHAATRAIPRSSQFKVINTGAWQRLISAETLAVKAKMNTWSSAQVLDKLHLSDLPPCYSFVWIPFNLGKSVDAKLRYWAYENGRWIFKSECKERETLSPE